MANQYKGEVRVRLADGNLHTLKYDWNAFAEFEGEMGMSLMGIRNLGADGFGIRHVRALVWAGLQHHEPEITIRDAGALLPRDPKDVGRITEACMRAVEQAFDGITTTSPDREDEDGGAEGEAHAPSGTPSDAHGTPPSKPA